jgi:hypothetical protein
MGVFVTREHVRHNKRLCLVRAELHQVSDSEDDADDDPGRFDNDDVIDSDDVIDE